MADYITITKGIHNFSAADIRVFLAENLPYYEAEDKDDFVYIVKDEDLERVSLELYRYLTIKSSQSDYVCGFCELPFDRDTHCPRCGSKFLKPGDLSIIR